MAIEESTPTRLTVPEVQDAYSRLAPLYGFWEALAEGRARKLALELANVRSGEAVLEVAVGTGTALQSLSRANSTGVTVGTDLTPAMLWRTRRRFRRRPLASPALCQADARLLPFGDSSFDLVFSSYLLELLSIPDIEKALQEMRRVMRPSGRLVLVHLSRDNPWFDRIWGFFYWMVPMLLGGCRPIRMATYLPSAGFTVVQDHRILQWGIPAEVILANREG
ncbi:MAG: methyltransferase domain-containing protein [Acidobacteria bacterium]|nr:methyltransferase domain-containing protein [Acidobacteriota bacterium]